MFFKTWCLDDFNTTHHAGPIGAGQAVVNRLLIDIMEF
jgi:hypothetical protein